ncbi:hypothetical protein VTN02DRAFT_1204 [Thermoascus thermophilus]
MGTVPTWAPDQHRKGKDGYTDNLPTCLPFTSGNALSSGILGSKPANPRSSSVALSGGHKLLVLSTSTRTNELRLGSSRLSESRRAGPWRSRRVLCCCCCCCSLSSEGEGIDVESRPGTFCHRGRHAVRAAVPAVNRICGRTSSSRSGRITDNDLTVSLLRRMPMRGRPRRRKRGT